MHRVAPSAANFADADSDGAFSIGVERASSSLVAMSDIVVAIEDCVKYC